MENFFKNAQMVAWIGGIAIAGVLFVIRPLNSIETRIALIEQSQDTIKSNHLQHLQDLAQEVKDLNEEQIAQEKQIIEMQKQILVILNTIK